MRGGRPGAARIGRCPRRRGCGSADRPGWGRAGRSRCLWWTPFCAICMS